MKKKVFAISTSIIFTLSMICTPVMAATNVTKEENVYVVMDANGNIKNKIVSDTLQNTKKGEKINDVSGLSGIKNISGDEKFKKSSLSKSLTWESNGENITYQGTTNKDLPVDVDITYTLNGTVVSADQLAGKSGNLKIRYDYSISSFSNASFVAVTGLMIDKNKISNIKITNGKAVEEGDKTVLVGYGAPGLNKSLNISQLNIPSYFEVSCKIKDFEMNGSMTYVTNEVFDDIDLSSVNSVMDLVDSLNKLSDASSQLVTGSDKLYEGINTLTSKTGTLSSGVTKLDSGGKKLASGSSKIKESVQTLEKGSSDLTKGLSTVKDGSTNLKTKMEYVGTHDVQDAITYLNNSIDGDKKALQALQESLQYIDKSTPQGQATYQYVQGAIKALYGTDGTNGTIAAQTGVLNGTKKLQTVLTVQTNDYLTNPQTLYDGAAALEYGVSTAYEGSSKITAGTDQLIKEGINPIVKGSEELSEGLTLLNQNSTKLINGIKQIQNGSKKLKDGMKQFDSDGIQKLVKAAGSIDNLKSRLNSTINASKNYNNFSGISSDMSGSVKFIYKTEAIEKK